ncbi:MAG: efflux RND transporter periplasmic adaptor subunit, partial [Bacteroidales bacterium]
MNKSAFIPVITITALLLSSSCKRGGSTSATTTEVLPDDIVEMRYDQIHLAGIDTGSVKMNYILSTIKVAGKVDLPPQNFVTVSAPLGGFIKSSSLLPGDIVTKGQVLAYIENQEFVNIEQEYLETRNKLEYAEAEYKRHSELFKEDVYSEKNLQQVTSDYKSLRVVLSALEQKLTMIGIDPKSLKEENITRSVPLISPISGYVKTVGINTGKSVAPSDILFEIVNTDRLYLDLTLFEKDASKVRKGQKVIFYINDENEKHEAEVFQTGRTIEPDKTFRVYALVRSDCRNVLPGMFVSANIDIAGKMVTSLPIDAVVSFDDKDYIFTYSRNKEEGGNQFTEYRMVEVTKGISDEVNIEVILPQGFNINSEKVVTKGAYNLLSA